HCAERQSAAERLCEREDVGNDTALLEREERSGASEAALDLVEDQDRAEAIGETPRRGKIVVGQRNDAALAHHRLENDRVCLVADEGFERSDVVRRNELDSGNERLERRAIRLMTRQRQRPRCAAVKALFERNELALAGMRQACE